MPDRSQLEALFTNNLEWVERVAASLCRRHGLDPAEAEEFLGWARLRLIENDYAILGKFRGECAVTTYLTVVLTTLFRDYRVSLWGRWRSSAAAKRRGELAVRLEALVYRDGYRLHQAGEMLRAGGHTDLSDRELRALLASLPAHAPPRPVQVGQEPLETMPAASRADDAVVAQEAADERSAAEAALRSATEGLAQDDRVIMRLWMQGMSVADIARALHVPQKPLYRRLEKIFGRLREELEGAGITREHVRRMLDDQAA